MRGFLAKQRHNILILNGPNLNMLGVREPDVYGFKNLSAIAVECEEYANEIGCGIDFRQSNHEGELVSIIQEVATHSGASPISGIIINAGAYSHTSIAIHDALKMVDVPVIEVHLSNTFKRESFRHISYIAPLAVGVICGFGGHSYILALDALAALLNNAK